MQLQEDAQAGEKKASSQNLAMVSFARAMRASRRALASAQKRDFSALSLWMHASRVQRRCGPGSCKCPGSIAMVSYNPTPQSGWKTVIRRVLEPGKLSNMVLGGSDLNVDCSIPTGCLPKTQYADTLAHSVFLPLTRLWFEPSLTKGSRLQTCLGCEAIIRRGCRCGCLEPGINVLRTVVGW